MSDLVIERGVCHALFAYDVGHAIDLEVAERSLLAAERQTVRQKRRTPAYFEYQPAPLRVARDAPAVEVAAGRRTVRRAYGLLLPGRARPLRIVGRAQSALAELAHLQLEGAVLFEQVTNALKLVGEQFLARVYRLVSQQFRLAEWDAGISRKLATLDSLYAKTADRAASRRMEVLKWIIIVLIALSMLLPFL